MFTWNREKFPDPRAAIARFKRQNVRVVVNLKPCLLDDHPAYAEVAARGAFVQDAKTKLPCIGQFWDGEGAHIDFTHPDGIGWWQENLRKQVLDVGIDAGWNDNNEYEIWDDDGELARIRHRATDRAVAAAACAADDACHGGSAGGASARRAPLYRHPRRTARHPALRADVVGRQYDELA